MNNKHLMALFGACCIGGGFLNGVIYGSIHESNRMHEVKEYTRSVFESVQYIKTEYARNFAESVMLNDEFKTPKEIKVPFEISQGTNVVYLPLDNEKGGYRIEVEYPKPTIWSKYFYLDDEYTELKRMDYEERK